MNSVWKYTLKIQEEQIIEMPVSSKVLSVESQGDEIVLYALVDKTAQETSKKTIRVYGTGHDIPESIHLFDFLGTVKMYNGSLMFHVFHKNS